MILAKLKTYAIAALGLLATLAGFAALLFRARSKQHQAEAEQAQQRADITEASRKAVTTANQRLQQAQERTRQDRLSTKERLQKGDRTQLEEDTW